jgi:uncharacterized membrane protein
MFFLFVSGLDGLFQRGESRLNGLRDGSVSVTIFIPCLSNMKIRLRPVRA